MAEKSSSSSSEWLPAGWTSTVKTSRNGNKYKCYTDPSHKYKFLSKPEVIRYLESVESNLQLKSEDNSDYSGQNPSSEKINEVVIEEAVAEGLPPGWIKEVRVTQRGKSIRRDLYYTDPTSGYVFLSLKDCKRYLKTGLLGKSSYKPKDKDHINLELENDNISSPAIDKGNEVQDGGADKPVTKNNEEILTPTITEDHIYLQYQNSGRSDLTGSDLNSQSTKILEQIEGLSSPVIEDYPMKLVGNGVEIHETDKIKHRINKSNSKKSSDLPRRASKRLAGVELDPMPMKLLENGVVPETDRIQHRINKSNAKKSSDFPRRASKRLAGVELDPVPELKSNDRTRRSAARQLGEATITSSGNTHNFPTTEELPRKFELETTPREQQRLSIALPLASLANSEEPVVQEKLLQISEKQAGEKEPSPISKEASPISKEAAAHKKPLPASREQDGDEDSMMLSEEEQGEKEKLQFVSKEQERADEIDAILESSTNFSMADLWQDPCIEFAIKTLTGVIPIGGEENQADKNSGSSAEISLSDIWTDPCIEFAVKTLTGAIPLDEDPSIQNLFQQQASSSDTQGVRGIMLPNINNFCQTDYISQHCNAVEKPQNSKQQVTAASRIPQTSTRSLQISAGSGLHQSIQGRNSGQRP